MLKEYDFDMTLNALYSVEDILVLFLIGVFPQEDRTNRISYFRATGTLFRIVDDHTI